MKSLLLAIGALVMLPVAAIACPVVTTGMSSLSVSEIDLTDPYRVEVIAGGDIDLSSCGIGFGYVIANPDFSVTLNDINGPLQLSVDSPGCDSLLLVNAGGGWYFDDDSSGDLLPYLEVPVTAGSTISVWVGTFDGSYCQSQLVLY